MPKMLNNWPFTQDLDYFECPMCGRLNKKDMTITIWSCVYCDYFHRDE